MSSRQQYRTMARMQRRRSFVQDRMSARQDFESAGQEQAAEAAPAAAAPDYTAELAKLAQLRDQGVITPEGLEVKKR
jgi:hypothetical protein